MIGTVFIGYDAREDEAAQVAAFSLRRRATCHLRIYALEHRLLRRLGLFTRPWRIDKAGQFYDEQDTRPFSTEFSHSRFLVFDLAQRLKTQGPCMFVDCDWLFQADVEPLLMETAKSGEEIGVVDRERTLVDGSTKMDGMVQQNYHRKLWSAMFTFMPGAGLAERFNPTDVSKATGRDLHSFLGMDDTKFWPIDPAWHFIPSLDQKPEQIKGIHYSEFSPWINPDKFSLYPDTFWTWEDERAAMVQQKAKQKNLRIYDNLEHDLSVANA